MPTRSSPVRRVSHPKATPLDLHALGTPPALILSQDQTLHQIRPTPRLPHAGAVRVLVLGFLVSCAGNHSGSGRDDASAATPTSLRSASPRGEPTRARSVFDAPHHRRSVPRPSRATSPRSARQLLKVPIKQLASQTSDADGGVSLSMERRRSNVLRTFLPPHACAAFVKQRPLVYPVTQVPSRQAKRPFFDKTTLALSRVPGSCRATEF